MLKKTLISEEENRGSIEFQVFWFTNKIQRLTSHLQLHKKYYLSQRGLRKNIGKTSTAVSLFGKQNIVHYKELIGQLNIREIKTR